MKNAVSSVRHIFIGFLAHVVLVFILSNRSYGCKVLSHLGSGTTPPYKTPCQTSPAGEF